MSKHNSTARMDMTNLYAEVVKRLPVIGLLSGLLLTVVVFTNAGVSDLHVARAVSLSFLAGMLTLFGSTMRAYFGLWSESQGDKI